MMLLHFFFAKPYCSIQDLLLALWSRIVGKFSVAAIQFEVHWNVLFCFDISRIECHVVQLVYHIR